MYLNPNLFESSEEENKYLAKHLAKETPAQGIHIQPDPKQEQHQEKLNLIYNAKGRAFINLINFNHLNPTISVCEERVRLCADAVNTLFGGLFLDDKYLEQKLNALVDKTKDIEICHCDRKPFESYQAGRRFVIDEVRKIREAVNSAFSFLS